MIKQIYVAVRDLCGAQDKAKPVSGRYNDTNYTLPAGWGHGSNKDFILCPRCLRMRNRL